MSFLRQIALVGVAMAVVSLSGCPLKKKSPPVPAQAQAPSTLEPEPAPAATQTEQPAPAEPQPTAQPAESQPTEKAEATPEKPEAKKKTVRKKPAPPPQQQPQTQASLTPPPPPKSGKLVIQEGSAPSNQGQLAAGVSLDDSSSHGKQTTEQLLQSTQANLNSLNNRPLSPEEQAMVNQIKDYMAQSRKATQDSDAVRAHNLALKAHLLSDELVKH